MTKSQGHVLEEDISKGPSWLSLAKRLASVTAVTRPILVTILVHREIWALCLTGTLVQRVKHLTCQVPAGQVEQLAEQLARQLAKQPTQLLAWLLTDQLAK